MNNKTIKLTLSALFLALGVIVPQIFHLAFPAAGTALLPMHLPVMFAGLFLGPYYGFIVGLLSPVLSHFTTGMPPISPVPVVIFMFFELGAYGFTIGFLKNKLNLNPILSLIGAMIVGRFVNFVVIFITSNIMEINVPPMIYFVNSLTKGVVGMVIQLIAIPTIYFAINNFLKHRKNSL